MTTGTSLVENRSRFVALERYRLFDGPPEPDLQAAVELAAQVCQAPMAVLHVLDAEHQHQVAAVGIETGVCRREDSMCSVAVVEPAPVLVEDATRDPRFASNPFVNGVIERFRFYAATQLCTPDGFVLGTLCVFDLSPRTLDDQQRHCLDQLGRMAVDVLELRRHGYVVAELLREQQRTRQALERANQTLRHFAAQLAHDLRSPLTGVLAFAAELDQLPAVKLDSDASGWTERISTCAQRMETLIEDVLNQATSMHAGKAVQVDLAVVTRQILDDLVVQVGHADAEIAIGELPTVTGDVTQWRILLQNLICNALKYRHPGRRCRVTVTAAQDAHCYRVCVVDNGIGIPADQRDEVVRPFTRLDGQRADGYGVGLSTCARILHAHGGRLEFGDTPGGGTTACIVMPVAAEAD